MCEDMGVDDRFGSGAGGDSIDEIGGGENAEGFDTRIDGKVSSEESFGCSMLGLLFSLFIGLVVFGIDGFGNVYISSENFGGGFVFGDGHEVVRYVLVQLGDVVDLIQLSSGCIIVRTSLRWRKRKESANSRIYTDDLSVLDNGSDWEGEGCIFSS